MANERPEKKRPARESEQALGRTPRSLPGSLRPPSRVTTRLLARGIPLNILVIILLNGGGLACRSLPWTSPEEPVEPLPVLKVEEEIVLAVWAEPPQLPEGGGQAQILVRVRKRGGKPFPGVEVRLATSTGSLYSGGRVLLTDARGMTRDRLTSGKTAVVTLNAGGTRYRFRVPVGEKAE